MATVLTIMAVHKIHGTYDSCIAEVEINAKYSETPIWEPGSNPICATDEGRATESGASFFVFGQSSCRCSLQNCRPSARVPPPKPRQEKPSLPLHGAAKQCGDGSALRLQLFRDPPAMPGRDKLAEFTALSQRSTAVQPPITADGHESGPDVRQCLLETSHVPGNETLRQQFTET